MKRIISLVLALSMVLSMFPVAFAGTGLKDINGTKYEAAVEALMELGVVSGYPNGTYLPENVVTRAELAKLLVVAYGLLPAAEASKGLTPFADVNAEGTNYWAAGYINVAADYKFINGYPDGSFGGNATVTYAEAITMCLRVLGYANVVEAKGTWPTNYIAKAQELGLMDEVSFKSYNDGATRGNIALLIWNMLQEKMWDVKGESEGDGLQFAQGKKMVEVKFPEYELIEDAVVTDITVADRKVKVELDGEDDYELAEGLDFLKLFGRTVTALYNKEDDVLATITPSAEDKVVEGDKHEDFKGYKMVSGETEAYFWGEAEDIEDVSYAVAVIGAKKVASHITAIDATDTDIVKEVKESKKGDLTIKLEESTLTVKESEIEDILVLIDGEWAYVTDIEVGDVVTTLIAKELYVVSRATVEGEFEGVKYEEDSDEESFVVEVDGEEYDALVDMVVYETDEDGERVATGKTLANLISKKDKDNKYVGEEVTLFLNFLGDIVEVRFGDVEELNSVTGNFYVLTNVPAVWATSDKSGVTYYVELDGESYEMAKNVTADIDADDAGQVVYVELDSKDRVTLIEVVNGSWEDPNEMDPVFEAYVVNSELTDKNYLGDHKVTSSTVVVTISEVLDDDDFVEGYEVSKSNGPAALKGIAHSLVITKVEDSLSRAHIVFVRETAKNTDRNVGIVEKFTARNGVAYITIDGEKYELAANTTAEIGDIVIFTEDEEDGITVKYVYTIDMADEGDVVIDAVEPRDVIFDDAGHIDLDALPTVYEKVEDYRTFLVEVDEDDAGTGYVFTSVEEIDFEDVKLKKDDYVDFNDTLEMTIIVRGIEVIH